MNTLSAANLVLPIRSNLKSLEGELDKAIGFWPMIHLLDMETSKSPDWNLEDTNGKGAFSKKMPMEKKNPPPLGYHDLIGTNERIGRTEALYKSDRDVLCRYEPGVFDNDLHSYLLLQVQRHHNKLSPYTTYLRNNIGTIQS